MQCTRIVRTSAESMEDLTACAATPPQQGSSSAQKAKPSHPEAEFDVDGRNLTTREVHHRLSLTLTNLARSTTSL